MIRPALIAAALLSPLAAQSQEATVPADAPLAIPMYDVLAVMPPPPWTNALVAEDDSEVYEIEGAVGENSRTYLLEYIPAGEGFDDWSQIYAVRAVTGVFGGVAPWRDQMATMYESNCRATRLMTVVDQPDRTVFVILCGEGVATPGYGVVSAFTYALGAATLVQLYHEVRVPAFDPEGPLPLTDAEIIEMARRVAALELLPR